MSPGCASAVYTARFASVALVGRTSAKRAPISSASAVDTVTSITSSGSIPAWYLSPG